MKTITVQIGNSDDKLTQTRWAGFINEIKTVIRTHGGHPHFLGGSSFDSPWQNVAVVFECREENIPALKSALMAARRSYGQNSIAYTEGETEFI